MSDTGPAKLPGIPALKTADTALQRWAQAVTEHLEVRGGARGNAAERSVTQRELLAATRSLSYLNADKSTTASAGELVLHLGGGMTVTVAIDAFAKKLFESTAYKTLTQRLDDKSRLDDIPEALRKLVLREIAETAATQGAAIVRVEKILQESTASLAYTIEEVTAAIQGASAGVRESIYALAGANRATAGKLTQVQARLDNFAGGGTGTATIEQKMSAIASNVTGLSAEYTLKVQAGGVFGGISLAAYLPADPSKPAYSSFLVAADKFGIVLPGGAGAARTPFGIDANGIYMASDVYIKGTMRVDAGGSTLRDGLRGSLHLGVTASAWSDTLARNAIFSALGRGASALDNGHLVIGDCITITSTSGAASTRYWNGTSWASPGVVISGDMIVDGGIAAAKIDTRGLALRDSAGNVILGAGVGLSAASITGLGALATKDSVSSGQVTGLGGLATKNSVSLGQNVTFPDGSTIQSSDLVSRLSKMTSGNIGTFMDGAAITNAYIGNAEINTLKIAGNSVTVPSVDFRPSLVEGNGGNTIVGDLWITLTQPGWVYAIFTANQTYGTGIKTSHTYLNLSGYSVSVGGEAVTTNIAISLSKYLPAGQHHISVSWTGQDSGVRISDSNLFAMGVMR